MPLKRELFTALFTLLLQTRDFGGFQDLNTGFLTHFFRDGRIN